MTARRQVRATASFFDDLDRQLDNERGPGGEPSVNDFQTLELLRVVETFAVEFDDLPQLLPGRADYRILDTSGVLVSGLAVIGQLAPDGAVELGSLELDLEPGWWQSRIATTPRAMDGPSSPLAVQRFLQP